MRNLRIITLALTLPALAACATTGGASSNTKAAEASPYGLFLAGQAALFNGEPRSASTYFQRADADRDVAADAEDDAFMKERAFSAALLSGDITQAAALARSIPPPAPPAPVAPLQPGQARRPIMPTPISVGDRGLGLLTMAVEDLATGKAKEAKTILASSLVNYPNRTAAQLLDPWASAMSGDMAAALARPQGRDRVTQVFGQLGQAELLEHAKRFEDAEKDYKGLNADPQIAGLFTLDYGGFLERQGRQAEAVKLYDAALVLNPQDMELSAARSRAAANKPPPRLGGFAEGAARSLVAGAATFASQRQSQFARAYLNLAIRLDPERQDAQMLLADLLAQDDDDAGAMAAYLKIKKGTPNYLAAQSKLVWLYQEMGDKETAMRLAQASVKAAPNDRGVALNLAELLRADERFAEAVTVMDGVIASAGAKPDWRLLYLRGVALERAGRSADAEADLTRALAAAPNEPELLNYLGFLWIDRGEHLDKALMMVQRAAAVNPRSGAVIDSLGWAYYRLGDYKQAVTQMERAVELEPADPEINNHLGDAYWRAGRHIEAEFQWRRVLTLHPDQKVKAEAEAKLSSGQGPGGPVAAR